MAVEVLDFPLVFFRSRACLECAKIAPFVGTWIDLA
jgi:hypothetical protein